MHEVEENLTVFELRLVTIEKAKCFMYSFLFRKKLKCKGKMSSTILVGPDRTFCIFSVELTEHISDFRWDLTELVQANVSELVW